MQDGEVVKYGQVFLGTPLTESIEGPVSFNTGKMKSMIRYINTYCEDKKANRITAWLLKLCKSRLEKEQGAKEN